jgi:hypothetical protein
MIENMSRRFEKSSMPDAALSSRGWTHLRSTLLLTNEDHGVQLIDRTQFSSILLGLPQRSPARSVSRSSLCWRRESGMWRLL